MTREQIHHVPVTDPNGTFVGIVTGRDTRLNVPSPATGRSAQEIGQLVANLAVRQIRTRSASTAGPVRHARRAAQLMLDHRIDFRPVRGCRR